VGEDALPDAGVVVPCLIFDFFDLHVSPETLLTFLLPVFRFTIFGVDLCALMNY